MDCQPTASSCLGKRSAIELPAVPNARTKQLPGLTPSQRSLLDALHQDLALAFDKTKIQILITRQIEILRFTNRPHFIFHALDEGSHPLTKLFEEVFVDVNILQTCAGIRVSPTYPVYFRKDELLSTLRVDHAFLVHSYLSLPDENQHYSEGLSTAIANSFAWIKELARFPDFYIPLLSLPVYFPRSLLVTAKRYIPSSAVLLLGGNEAYAFVRQFFNIRYRADLRGYYIKSDFDSRCEIKAQQILQELTHGFNRFRLLYQAKFSADFSHGRIGTQDLGICLVSKEVVAASEDFYLFDRYNEAFLKFKASQFRNNLDVDKHKNELAREEANFERHGKFSLPFHILMDLIFISCDSHAGQYVPIFDKQQNIEYVNIDFSRILPESEVAMDGQGHLYSLLRSAYLFAPHCLKPMSPELIKLINSWDIESIKKGLQHLVGRKEVFTLHNHAYRAAYRIGNGQEALNALSQNCYSKIHPNSFELFIGRLIKTKEYIKATSHPSVYGLFVCLYPDLAAIMTALSRRISHPTELVGFKKEDPQNPKEQDGERPIIPKPIASYLDKIKRDRLATPDEWNLLLKHYENLTRKAIRSEDVIQFFAGT